MVGQLARRLDGHDPRGPIGGGGVRRRRPVQPRGSLLVGIQVLGGVAHHSRPAGAGEQAGVLDGQGRRAAAERGSAAAARESAVSAGS